MGWDQVIRIEWRAEEHGCFVVLFVFIVILWKFL